MEKFVSDVREALFAQIKAQMALKGLNQKELAERLNMAPAVLSRYMRGHRDMPLEIYLRVSDSLGVPPDYLLTQAKEQIEANAAAKDTLWNEVRHKKIAGPPK